MIREDLVDLWLETKSQSLKDRIIYSSLELIDPVIEDWMKYEHERRDMFQEGVVAILYALHNMERYKDKYKFKDVAKYYIRVRITDYVKSLYTTKE